MEKQRSVYKCFFLLLTAAVIRQQKQEGRQEADRNRGMTKVCHFREVLGRKRIQILVRETINLRNAHIVYTTGILRARAPQIRTPPQITVLQLVAPV